MKALCVLVVTWWAAVSFGRTLLDHYFRAPRTPATLRRAELFVFSSALGLGVIAYGIFVLGLFGALTPVCLVLWLGIVLVAGVRGGRPTALELRTTIVGRSNVAPTRWLWPASLFDLSLIAILGLLCIVAVAACFSPPGAHAWDALAYHLADPKIFLAHHRIIQLPTEHHSNFPFTTEMLFTMGLALDGYAAANLFHLLTAVLLILAVHSFCRRFLSQRSALIAAVVLATTPLVLWEASIAYIDLGLALFVFLAAYCVLLAAHGGSDRHGLDRSIQSRLLLVSGTLLGVALGIKYLALVPLVLIAALAAVRRLPLRQISILVGVAFLVGSPWYIKNIVWTRNPVYPFAYSLFPTSRYWSADRAAPYAEEQRSFGTAHEISQPLNTLRNLVVTPWKMVSNPDLYTNRADFTFTSLIGGLYAGFALSLCFLPRKPAVVTDVAGLVLAMFAAWFLISQHIRYLIPALPFAAVLSGYAADVLIARGIGGDLGAEGTHNRTNVVNIVAALIASGAILGQCVTLGWGILTLPVSGRAAADAQAGGLEPTALSLPEIAADITRPDERDRHLRRLSSYGATEWINRQTRAGEGVILYEDVFGYYLDRPYLWGNGEHSSYIPYDRMRSGSDLTQWLRGQGVKYALFDLNFTPANQEHSLIPDNIGTVTQIMRTWYDGTGNGWRKIVGEAIVSGQWQVKYAHHGAVVLEIGEPAH